MDVNKGSEKNVVRIVGSLSSLDAAVLDLDKVIQQVEKKMDGLPQALVDYLTARGITALQDIKDSHPNVRIGASKSDGISCRGAPSDIEAVRQDLEALHLTASKMRVSAKEASVVIGKKGSTVESIVFLHQTAIDVERQGESENSTVTVIGPEGHVESAVQQIKELLAANKDVEKTVEIRNIKTALLLENGKGIQGISKSVNAKINDPSAGMVHVNLSDEAIVVKGKARVMEIAYETVAAEVRRLEQIVKVLKVDPMAIPAFIGKGGAGAKALRADLAVSIDFDRDNGEITIAGMESSLIDQVYEKTQKLSEQYRVARVQTDPPSLYKSLAGMFVRNLSKEVNELVYTRLDDDKQQIILRGSQEKLDEAQVLINKFFEQNFVQELEVAKDDIETLLTGGQGSKIVELGNEAGVKMSAVRDRQVVVVRGEKAKVHQAIKNVKLFLYGGEGISLVKMSVDGKVLGMVIGKGGKNRAEMEKKHNINIMIQRHDNVVSLRGPDVDVEACRLDIMKMIVTAKISHQLKLPEKKAQAMEKSKSYRRAVQHMPVQVNFDKSGTITIRGTKDAVRDAEAALREAAGDPYEIGYFLESVLFKRVKEAWKDPESLKRIESASGAKIKITKDAILFTGSREEVKKAKVEVIKFLKFLLGSQFTNLELESALLDSMCMSGKVTNVMAESGCQLLVDRDLSSVLILSSDSEKVAVAKEILEGAIEEEKKLLFVLKLEKNEDWIVSTILGKNGKHIQSLRKETKCKIDVLGKTVTVRGDSEELVAAGTERIKSIVDKARKESAFVDIPKEHMAAFVGKGGSNISKFAENNSVEISAVKRGSHRVRINGEEEAVVAAQSAIDEWIADRESKASEEQATESITVEKEQVPKVIGNKGTVIRSLEKEFRCKIDIDRKENIVTVKGHRRVEVIAKIEKILSGELDVENNDEQEVKAETTPETPINSEAPIVGEKEDKSPPQENEE